MELQIVAGLVFAAVAIGVPYGYERLRGGNTNLSIKFPLKLPSLRRGEKIDEKMKEIDKKLEEVVSAPASQAIQEGDSKQVEEKTLDISGDIQVDSMVAENVDVPDNLLDEMQTGDRLVSEAPQQEDEALPDVPELPELPSEDLNSDLEIDTEDIDGGFGFDESEGEDEGEEEVDFDEHDDLIAEIAKEVEVKEEEELDLLRDLKGQKFDIDELQSELENVLVRLKEDAQTQHS